MKVLDGAWVGGTSGPADTLSSPHPRLWHHPFHECPLPPAIIKAEEGTGHLSTRQLQQVPYSLAMGH